eukprot:CAMPEP_0114617964 /NCGR_PEP_ID=MMETSP0168-20121206/7465_1 /TAXON_ID=95228 ORGANISM="Vannella sp., Strain DIVA3 517/6/12" /NCGR_SAMPLE_ID=MMETSP0168 /ASSEMBLY_ACC=CAM_ASM_000044 /LENGTH=285 /DNA_ID=CAMNT_0001829109 /DNA_START=30 /DNA_END=884 /DNA_ORIENTATION=+
MAELERRLREGHTEARRLSSAELREALAQIATARLHRPALVVEYASELLKRGGLGDAEWAVQEQLATAALHVGAHGTAAAAVAALGRRFGGASLRVARLEGMCLEAAGRFEQARRHYGDMLGASPTNQLVLKRRICVEEALGNRAEAIVQLCEYLDVYMGDEAAWLHLASLYEAVPSLQRAAFCFEELLLIAPFNYHYHTRYAEVLQSIGGVDNLLTARRYYSHSVSLRKTPRALFGLLTCCKAVAGTRAGRGAKDNERLLALAREQLATAYAAEAPSLAPLLEA